MRIFGEDLEVISEWHREEAAYAAEMGRQHMNMATLMEEHSTDANAKMGEVMKWRDGRWVPKRSEEEYK